MSATGRNKKDNERDENDYYPTPQWCVHRLLEKINLPCDSYWIEPTAGDGSIVRAVKSYAHSSPFYNTPSLWKLIELQPEFEPYLRKEASNVFIGNFLDFDSNRQGWLTVKADVCIGNPPYGLALPIIKHAMLQANVVCMLLRLNFLASGKRAPWMQENTPDIYVLPNRPSFKGKGTDATEYAWFVWSHGIEHGNGKVKILNPSSREERLRDKKESIKIIEEYKTLAAKQPAA